MKKILIKISLFTIIFINISLAETINGIEINGNKRLSRDSIIVLGKIEIDKNYDQNDLNNILKDLYSSNFFKQITIKQENNKIILDIIENPIIEDLKITGIENEKFKEQLLDAVKLKNRNSYVEYMFLNDVILIKNILKVSGYYFAKVKTSSIKNEKQNSIRITYDIELGDKAKISEIVFLGDKIFKDRKLKNIIVSEESKFWKFISRKTYIEMDRIDLDTRLLANFYKNNGFYNAKIENSFIEFQDNNSFKLIFKINAGNKFTFNNLDLDIPVDYESKYFQSIDKLLSKLKGENYSLIKISKIIDEIDKVALSKQYEFVNAEMSEKIVDDNKVDIMITFKDTEKTYVEKINILGNQFTIEEVLRNSLIVDEGDPFNEILFNKSLNNLRAKGIFSSVKSKIKKGSRDNLKNIDIIVEEKPTGEISLGAGVGTSGGTIGGGIRENNFLGRGITIDTDLALSANSIKGKFVYSKPNFNYTENTLFTSLQSTSSDNLKDFGYKTSEVGLSVGTRFLQYEDLYFSPELSASLESLETTSTASAALRKQDGDYLDIYFNYSFNHDLRDQSYQPTDGHRTIFSQELPLSSENYEIVNAIDYSTYYKLSSEMVTRIGFYGKAINTIADDDVRLSKRLYLPGSRLRGFEYGKIGPKDNGDYVGGNYVSAFNISTTLPQILPSFQNTDFAIFFDAANVWGVDYNSSIDKASKIRSSTGISMDLNTPVGPMNFSLSQPITKSSSDKTESFRFNLGTTF